MNGAVLGVTATVNGVGLLVAATDHSWGALGMMLLLPAANLLIAIVFTALSALRPERGESSVAEALATSWLVPIAATVISHVTIASMGLHGC